MRTNISAMCILALCSHFSSRFPFFMIHNRDEFVSRGTAPIAVERIPDIEESILWSRDTSTPNGGSWMGLSLGGRFCALTNCRRSPVPVLPEAEIHRRLCREASTGRLQFVPDASRGIVVRDYLRSGEIAQVPQNPTLDGFNLVSADLRRLARDTTAPVEYTTNRGQLHYRVPLEPGAIHAMGNAFMDDFAEPKTERLRDLVSTAMSGVGPDVPLESVMEALALCLCARPNVEVRDMDLLAASQPFLGLSDVFKRTYFPNDPPQSFLGSWDVDVERELQRHIYTVISAGYRTRTQTLVVVERSGASGPCVHYWTRGTRSPDDHDDWVKFKIPL